MYFPHQFIILMITGMAPFTDSGRSESNEFVFALSEPGRDHTLNPYVQLLMTSRIENDVPVNMTFPVFEPTIEERLGTIPKYESLTMVLPKSVLMTGIEVGTNGAAVLSVYPITVTSVWRYGKNIETMLLLPRNSLGMDYNIASWPPGEGFSHIGLTGTENQTVILLVVPTGAVIEFNGQNYTETKLIYMSLNKYETIQIQSKDDLTGTYIVSSHPIAVISGTGAPHPDTKITASSTLQREEAFFTVEMIPAKDTWGKTFVCIPLPNVTTSYRVIGGSQNTEIVIEGDITENITIQKVGDFITKTLLTPVYIVTSHPVMLVIYYSSRVLQDNSTMSPPPSSMMVVPPVEQWLRFYKWQTPKISEYFHYILIIANTNFTNTFFLDFQPLLSNWATAQKSGLSATYVEVKEDIHTIRNTNPDVQFGVSVCGINNNGMTYAHPAGMNLAKLYSACIISHNLNDDGDDNDCDGRVDEEVDDGFDNDGDGRIDEDCFTVFIPGIPPSSSTPTVPEVSSNANDSDIQYRIRQIRLATVLLCMFLGPIVCGLIFTALYILFHRIHLISTSKSLNHVHDMHTSHNSLCGVETTDIPSLVRVQTPKIKHITVQTARQ